jgi:cell division inhibitor SulA/protein ImuA
MELLVSTPGCGEISLLLPALIGLARQAGRIAWVSPPYLPYPPALFQKGLEQLLVIRSERSDDGLWASEQLLRSGACAAVLCWPGKALDDRRFRRLQLAAETGRTWGIVFRHRPAGNSRSPAALRLAVTARHDQQHITVLKRRGALPTAAIDLPRPTGIGP